ncbi:16S rRNA (cytosine(1402)-N(4))-methyltransferase RsmH [Deltaproteobacteria bacterium IMCC39524]|nr:16S rRNA (cytosine(1402)-N(4))-methyltransferase RsmH [Deltaproteobacteria bacterium IMCC39524]
MSSGGFKHVSVMAEEVMQYLQPHSGGVYLDGTLGGAGHARLILEASSPDGVLIGMDRDTEALAAAQRELASFGERVVLRQGNFSDMCTQLDQLEIAAVDGILLDLGVSSHQIDSPERGFSFREDGPLDMRMNPKEGVSAATVVAETEADELKRIFRDYGEERWAGKIARAIVTDREKTPFVTTLQLADLISRVVPAGRGPQRIHPATRVFQALRIHVNGELDNLRTALDTVWLRLKTGGRLVVISFHSLEDRMVKQAFRALATGCVCPPRFAVCACGEQPSVRVLTRKAVRATESETENNPRARSAVLRAMEKLPAKGE